MGSQLVAAGKTQSTDYRIYNIDNIYTVYIMIDTLLNPDDSKGTKPVYSAIKSFPTLNEAKEYAAKLTK